MTSVWSRHLQAELRPAFERQRHRDEAVFGIADELEEIGFGIVVHDVAADAKLRRDDLDDLARERRTLLAWPTVDQDEVDGAAEIAQRLARIALADLGVGG